MSGRSGRVRGDPRRHARAGRHRPRPRAAGQARRACSPTRTAAPGRPASAGRPAADEPLPGAGDAAGRPRAARWTPSPCPCLQPEGGEAVELLRPGRRFAEGASGWLRPKQDLSAPGRSPSTSSPRAPLEPATRYTVRVRPARGGGAGTTCGRRHLELHHRGGRPVARADVPARPGRRAGPLARPVLLGGLQRHLLLAGGELRADLRADGRGPQGAPPRLGLSARLLADGHRVPPAAASSPQRLPNIVRERETRRIAAIEPREGRPRAPRGGRLRPRAVRHPRRPAGGRGLPPGRRGPHRRRRPRRPHQGPRRR